MVVCAGALDFVTTRIGLMHGLDEVNPLAAASIDLVGLAPSVLLLKSPAVILALLARRHGPSGDLAPLALVVLWSGASVWNIYHILQAVA
jgi:hypothetical protein